MERTTKNQQRAATERLGYRFHEASKNIAYKQQEREKYRHTRNDLPALQSPSGASEHNLTFNNIEQKLYCILLVGVERIDVGSESIKKRFEKKGSWVNQEA